MGLAGNLGRGRRSKKKAAAARGGRPADLAPSGTDGRARGVARGKKSLMDLEIDIDRLLMKVVEFGELTEVESDLRRARRHLYAVMAAGS
jgi:hypothetical protein